MKLVSPFHSCQNAAPIQQFNLNEINRQLDALNNQHAAITEKLRLLHGDINIQNTAELKWHDVEHQVVKLRFEIESFKQSF